MTLKVWQKKFKITKANTNIFRKENLHKASNKVWILCCNIMTNEHCDKKASNWCPKVQTIMHMIDI